MVNTTKQAELIYMAISPHRKNPYQLDYDGSLLIKKIQSFISEKKPIKLLIPACHGKIKNFTFDHLPDYGEYLGINNFAKIVTLINENYEYGAELTMIHEGHFYVDTILIETDKQMDQYMESMQELLQPFGFIKSMDLCDFFPSLHNNSQRRKFFFEVYAPSSDEIDSYIATDTLKKALYISYRKIYIHNYKLFFPNTDNPSQKEKKTIAAEHARKQLQMYLGFGKLVSDFFKNDTYIRLSTLYKTPDVMDQFSLNYLPNTHHLSTPSFNCVVQYKNGLFDFIKYSDGLKYNYQVAEFNGLRYFKE